MPLRNIDRLQRVQRHSTDAPNNDIDSVHHFLDEYTAMRNNKLI